MSSALQETLLPPIAPPPIHWWPPAPGWWALALLLLILMLLIPWAVAAVRRSNLRRSSARQSLESVPDELEDREWLAALNTQVKGRLKRQGHVAALTLHGESWLDYLCQSYPDARRSALQPLAADLYRPALHLSAEQRRDLKRELRRWMRHNHV